MAWRLVGKLEIGIEEGVGTEDDEVAVVENRGMVDGDVVDGETVV